MLSSLWMVIEPQFDHSGDIPLYRQLSGYLQGKIVEGELRPGDRLPPTRDLAGQLGLNRTTISAAYDLLHADGLIESRGARGSFVRESVRGGKEGSSIWERSLNPSMARTTLPPSPDVIDFTTSRPSSNLFPLAQFQSSCREVLASSELEKLLQLGSPRGYEPLRQYLLGQAEASGLARDDDDILITNGCQQAVDLLRRALVRPGDRVLIEEPVYPGLRNSFEEAGADLSGIKVGADGIDLEALETALRGAKLLVVTPSFQNPTGASIPAEHRLALLSMAEAHGVVVVENGIYADLRYSGPDLKALKFSDPNVIFIGSFSKMAFPGLRVGWIIAPSPVIDRVAELKQITDLHTDQLSQAFLLNFAENGMLAEHRERAIAAGKDKLRAMDLSVRRHLAGCSWNLPAGGMNLWLELPQGIDAGALRVLARQAGVDFLPGSYFSVSRSLVRGLRLSFIGLDSEQIRKGIEVLGNLVSGMAGGKGRGLHVPAPALV